ncbi:MAG: glycosyltransferase [Bacteroidia bacterium]
MLIALIVAASLNVILMTTLAVLSGKHPPATKPGEGKKGPSSAERASKASISIIIAARNEAENLQRFLPSVLRQDFPGEWEVIVALDRCSDDSAAVVVAFQPRHRQLRLIAIEALPEGWTGKKFALDQGIKAAKFEIIALTDADCELPPKWLAGMQGQFEKGNDLVLGVSPYFPAPGLLNLFIRFETWMTALLYTGLAKMGLAYMGVGRSLAYRRKWFESAGGFAGIAGRVSGDDDLLVNHAAHSGRVGVLTGIDYQVVSLPKRSWGEWFRQKVRHGSAGTAYSLRSLLILSGIHGLQLFFYLSLIVVVLCVPAVWAWALLVYLLRTSALMGVLAAVPWKSKTMPWLAFPVLDIAYLIYLILLPLAALRKQPKWK